MKHEKKLTLQLLLAVAMVLFGMAVIYILRDGQTYMVLGL